MLLTDRYHLEEPLGRGAMGEVWRATDQALDRAVAVKLLRADETADADRFRLEAQTAARLNHPHLVSVYDFGSHHDWLYLVMELIDGWTLAQERSLRRALPTHEATGIAAQMAAGLAAAHSEGVVHRDIKPANVMLTADRTVKVTDFSIARFADTAASTLTASGKILGSADYLAPERALGRPAHTASDVYSLGCVLYELLTGRPPFLGATTLAVVKQHVDAAQVPPTRLRPEIQGPLGDYLMRLLAKDPAQRPTAGEAAAWLTGPLPEERPSGTTFVPPHPAPRSSPTHLAGGRAAHSRPRGRRLAASKAALGGSGILLFAAAAALGASLNSGGDPSAPATDGTAPSPSAPAREAPPSGAPSVTPPPSLPSPTLEDPRDDPEEQWSGEHQRKGKGQQEHD
ncbi:protein kinase [Streptomyces sp. Y7]|uniref:serine/threonine-protein kinase n=1 Tax=Streptomyces sp. Y7 TaxID=3342392 RepID=UPI00371017EF